MGMPAPTTPGKPAPPPPRAPAPSGALPPDLARGKVATPVDQSADGGLAMDDWDDDEPPTNIYSKENAAEMAQAAVASSKRDDTGGSRPSLRAPESLDVSEPEPVPVEKAPFGGKNRMILFGGIAAAVVAMIVVLVIVLVGGGGGGGAGTLELTVDPKEGLKVVIDGSRELPGTISPFKITDLTEGEHTITVTSEGFKGPQVPIKVEAGGLVQKTVSLERDATGFFLETDPPGASVWVDDRPYDEKTPITVSDLEPGTYEVRIAKGDSYHQKTLQVEVQSGQIAQLPKKVLELVAIKATFTSDPSGATITLKHKNDERKLGTTPVTEEIETDKKYSVILKKDGYDSLTEEVTYEEGQEQVTLAYRLEEKKKPKPSRGGSGGGGGGGAAKRSGPPGTFSVNTRPWSKVSINGKFIRNTPLRNHKLKPGKYTVVLENPTFNIKKTFRVTITSGQETKLTKNLI
jgi:hypothetical protein